MTGKCLMGIALALGACALGGETLAGGMPSVTPAIQGTGDIRAWWLGRFADKCDRAKKGGAAYKIAFVGDSITENWEAPGTAIWEENWSSAERLAINLGFGGDTTANVLWRLEHGQMDGLDPKVVVLLIGANNLGSKPEPAGDTIYGVRLVVRTLLARCPNAKIILHGILPRGFSSADPMRARIAKINPEIARIADGRRVLWCDFGPKLLAPDGTLTKEIAPDGLHLSAKGHEIWAAALKPYIDYALGFNTEMPAGAAPGEPPETYTPDQPRMSGWIDYRIGPKRMEIFNNPTRVFDLVLVGDSITHMWEERAVIAMSQILPGCRILNLGFSGDKTENIVWDATDGGLFDDYEARVITLMIGTNNRWSGKDSPEKIAAGVKRCLVEIRKHQPKAKLLLLPVFPTGAKPDDPGRKTVNAINAIIRNYADGKDVEWLDFTDQYLEPDGTLSTKLFPDLLHPADDGYNIWAHALVPYLKK